MCRVLGRKPWEEINRTQELITMLMLPPLLFSYFWSLLWVYQHNHCVRARSVQCRYGGRLYMFFEDVQVIEQTDFSQPICNVFLWSLGIMGSLYFSLVSFRSDRKITFSNNSIYCHYYYPWLSEGIRQCQSLVKPTEDW